MVNSAEFPLPKAESPKTLETLNKRAEVISTVNETHALMEALAGDPSATTKQKIDFGIVREGRKLLIGADIPLGDDEPSDRFINEVTDSATGKVFKISEGLPAEPLMDVLSGEIHGLEIRLNATSDVETQELLRRLIGKRQNQLDTIDANSSPYKPSNDEERRARVEKEAYLIFVDPERANFSRDNDWYTAESVVANRRFVDLPPRLTVNERYGQVAPVKSASVPGRLPLSTVNDTGDVVSVPLPGDFGQDKVTDAYLNGYPRVSESAKRNRRMPNPDGTIDLDMPEGDEPLLDSEGNRIPNSSRENRRRMPNPDGTIDLDMPDADESGLEADDRIPNRNKPFEGRLITDAYTGESVRSDAVINGYGLQAEGDRFARRGDSGRDRTVPSRDNTSAFSDLPDAGIPDNRRVTDAYGLKTEEVSTDISTPTGRSDRDSQFSDLAGVTIPEDRRVTNAFGLRTEERPVPGRSGSERSIPSRSDRINPFADVGDLRVPAGERVTNAYGLTRERPIKADVESRRRRLKALPRVLIPIIGLIGMALLSHEFGSKLASPATAATTPYKPGGHEEFDNTPLAPVAEKPKPNLAHHSYTNEPDASGSYGSFYGHELHQLGRVLDPTIQEDEAKTGIPISADDPRIEKALDYFQRTNPNQFEEIIDTYRDGVKTNNEEVVIDGDKIVASRGEFDSKPMKDVYDEVMLKRGGTT